MDNKYKYFLAVAEELNMSLAAKRMFISHQGISNAIRQLENEFGVILFNRYPKLKLTPQGEIMVTTLKKMNMLETNLRVQMNTEDANCKGLLQVGITSSNYDALVPEMVAGFKEKYPYMRLEVEADFSVNLEEKLLSGALDMYIGAGHIATNITKLIHVITESYFFVCSVKVLQAQLGEKYYEYIVRNCEGCFLSCFNDFPVIYYPKTDKLQQSIESCAKDRDIVLENIFECKDSNVIVKLAARGIGGGIVTDFAIPAICELNLRAAPEDYLYIFPITDLTTDCNEIFLAYHPDMWLSRYHLDFIELIRSTLANFKPEADKSVILNNQACVGMDNGIFHFLY